MIGGSRRRWLALPIASVAVAMLPWADMAGPSAPEYPAMIHGALAVAYLLAAGQLMMQVDLYRTARVLVAGGGLVAVATVLVANLLVASSGDVGAAIQHAWHVTPRTELYLLLSWHVLLPAAFLTTYLPWPWRSDAWRARRSWALTAAVVAGLAVGGAWVAAVLAANELLPDLGWTGDVPFAGPSPLRAAVLPLDLVAMAVVAVRERVLGGLSTWFFVALVAAAGDALLTFSSGNSSAIGGYAGRALSAITIGIVILGLGYEMKRAAAGLATAEERERGTRQLLEAVSHDLESGLLNEAGLRAALADLVTAAIPTGLTVSVIVLELDGAADIAAGLGYDAQAELLRSLAERTVPGAQVTARHGDARLAVVATGGNVADARRLAEAMAIRLSAPVTVRGVTVFVSARAGLAVYPDHASSPDELLRAAEIAADSAVRGSRQPVVYAAGQVRRTTEDLILLGELRAAAGGGEGLLLEYQPKVRLADGAVVGAEALIRWDHPRLGRLAPGRFIPLAEPTEVIDSIARWGIRAALAQSRHWIADQRPIAVAVNLPARSLADTDLATVVGRMLDEAGVDPGLLRLEVTETGVMSDVDAAVEVLVALKSIGVGLSVDDFGTGQSSLAYVGRLPVDEIKIDRSFVRSLSTDRASRAIVAAAIGLGESLGLTVLAEGVEDPSTRALLAELGCELGQGFLFGRPMAADRLAAQLESGYPSL